MKLQKAIRMQAMLVGLGGMLLLGSAARAQQDVSPTTFDVNPGTPSVEVKATAQAAPVAATETKANLDGAIPASIWSNEATKQEADLARLTAVDAVMVVILMVGVGLIVAYAIAATRRERRLQVSPQSARYTPAS